MKLSVVIPVYNEEDGLAALYARLYPALDALGISYEVIFVNDGSRDRSAAILREQFARRPDVTRVILLNGNFGQHMAILAGFERTRGERIVTLDADLQNPPEEIAKLLAKMDGGFDYVGGVRSERHDNAFRRYGSRATERGARAHHQDPHDRPGLHAALLQPRHRSTDQRLPRGEHLHPARSPYTFAHRPTEVEVAHETRAAGSRSTRSTALIRLNFDLVTGFSVCRCRSSRLFGILIAVGSVLVYLSVMPRAPGRRRAALRAEDLLGSRHPAVLPHRQSCSSASASSASTSAASTSRCASAALAGAGRA
jgi:undecaprenyl-phosphate 4-deoxy-4-formamido-L-arabinose transferase